MGKKILFVCFVLFSCLIFSSNNSNLSFVDPVIVEITDTTLEDVYYHQNSFTEPTKLVFTNLTSVSGYIYFHQNTNLVEVDFPQLVTVNNYIYFHGNTSLEIINAPNLTSVRKSIHISGQTSLQELNICNLKQITGNNPSYYIDDNGGIIDNTPICFSKGPPENLEIDNTSIEENKDINSLVGTLSADSNYENGNLTYYVRSSNFTISGNQLLTSSSFDFENKNGYNVKIGVINQLGEKVERNITINILDVLNENVATIEITDTTLENIYYHENSFTEPTKLVFTNLTSVSGYIYFHQNINLVEVDFPQLVSADDYVYFHGNASLEIINAPNLTSVRKSIHISGQTSLQELNICNLKQITGNNPSYYIDNNGSVIDNTPICFSKGPPENLEIDNTSIEENKGLNSLVGTLSADSNYENGNLTYYVRNENFQINGNQLLTDKPIDFESKNEYKLKIGVRNQLGEKLERSITINVLDVLNEEITIIEITDTTLESVFYHKDQSFISPTKLVFTNLTSVNGYIYFHENINLVEVEFPELLTNKDYFYVNGNPSLLKIDAPKLNTVYEYIYVAENKLLEELNICSLSQILKSGGGSDAYYYIKNNINLDFTTTCLTNTYLSFNAVDEIIIKPAPNTLIGTFSTDAGADIDIRYFFVDEDGNETTNVDFVIVDNGLYLAREYTDYTDYTFDLNINALRTVNLSGTSGKGTVASKLVASTVDEKIDLELVVNIGATLSTKDFFNDIKMTFYPNPTDNYFSIKTEKSFDEVSVFDMNGRYLKTFKPADKYNVSNMSTGMYLVILKENNTNISDYKKLIVK